MRGPNVFMGYGTPRKKQGEAQGWLRTGDLGRIDPEGNIYLTGRSKYIIVLESGEKVHPDELEKRLTQSEVIEDICITGRKESRRRSSPQSFTPNPKPPATRGGKPDEETLRKLVGNEIERLGKRARGL